MVPDPTADHIIERIFGKKAEKISAKPLQDDEILSKFQSDPESVDVEDVTDAFYRRLRRSL